MNELEEIGRGKSLKGLDTLVDRIIETYDETKGINLREEEDLPSKQEVIEILNELMTVIFPSYYGKINITKANMCSIIRTFLSPYMSD